MSGQSGNIRDAAASEPPTDRERLEWDRKLRTKEQSVRDLTAALKLSHKDLKASERRFDMLSALRQSVPKNPIRPRKGLKSESTAFAIASDWHLEEYVDPKTVNGLNEFNLEIAKDSARRFFQNTLRLVEQCRITTTIDHMVLGLLGDFINNHLVEEMVEENLLSPVEAILFAKGLLIDGIDFLLARGNFKKLVIPCCHGNHGRLNPKVRKIATAAKNSLEWMMYHDLARHFRSDPRAVFIIADGPYLYLPVYDHLIRFHHGDSVRGGGGVGGIAVPLLRATYKLNEQVHADLTVVGHWHQSRDFHRVMINGCLVGYGVFSSWIHAAFEEPSQQFFLIDRDHGKTIVAPIRVRPRKERK